MYSFIQGGGLVAPPEFISAIGTLLPFAPCGRTSLYNTTAEHPRDRDSRAFVSDIRTWDGGIREFLIDAQCDPEMIDRVMADEMKTRPIASIP